MLTTTELTAGRRDSVLAERWMHAFGGRLAAIIRSLELALSREVVLQAVVLLAVAVLTRSPRLGDPAISGDEQFYLLVGDRIWQGALPFVDIWDRKPIGLFLLYALFRPLSSDGIMSYQVAVLLFSAATAFVLARIARRVAGAVAAAIAGGLYLVYLPIIGGAGGQSPVFYDLFTACAAWLVVRCMGETNHGALWRRGLGAMLLTGFAIQVKYTALFEGVAFGMTMLWLRWRLRRDFLPVAVFALSLIAVALAPTALAFGCYAIEGHSRAFFTANFVSIFQKSEAPGFSEVTAFLVPTAIKMAPILLLFVVAMVGAAVRRLASLVIGFALLWSAFAFVEFFAIGHYYDHYAIPALMPMVIVIASLLDWAPFAITAPSLAISALLVTQNGLSRSRMVENQTRVTALTRALSPYARLGCIYLNDGPPILYLTTRSCLPTRYPFPGHLTDFEESVATDANASMAALLSTHPSAILAADHPRINPRNPITDAMVKDALASKYHLTAMLPDTGPRTLRIYVRNDLR